MLDPARRRVLTTAFVDEFKKIAAKFIPGTRLDVVGKAQYPHVLYRLLQRTRMKGYNVKNMNELRSVIKNYADNLTKIHPKGELPMRFRLGRGNEQYIAPLSAPGGPQGRFIVSERKGSGARELATYLHDEMGYKDALNIADAFGHAAPRQERAKLRALVNEAAQEAGEAYGKSVTPYTEEEFRNFIRATHKLMKQHYQPGKKSLWDSPGWSERARRVLKEEGLKL